MGKLDRPTAFIIVGDHAPPFGDPALRNKFSQSDVPYVILLPRSDHYPYKALLAHNAANLDPGAAKSPRQTP
jgi:phosphoglycerol transferase MdoB-like AlkP superfamily enzyme